MDGYLEYYQNRTVLVTGGAGAIGSNLSRRLAELGARVIILDDLSSGAVWNVPPDSLFIWGDILARDRLEWAFSEHPQVVFHLAAFFANQNSVDHPERDLMVNGMGTLRLLERSVLAGVDRFVYTSSSAVAGADAPLPQREEFVSMRQTTPYQVTKMLGELYCNFFYSHYALKTVRLRLFNSYGPGEVPGRYRNVIPNFVYWALKGQSLLITGTGQETRDFTYVGDIVDGILRAGFSQGAVGKAFNLGRGKETRIVDLANKIKDITESESSLCLVSRRKWDVKSRRCASIERASKILGYRPDTPLDVGLSNTVQWFRDHWDEIESSL